MFGDSRSGDRHRSGLTTSGSNPGITGRGFASQYWDEVGIISQKFVGVENAPKIVAITRSRNIKMFGNNGKMGEDGILMCAVEPT